MKKINTVIYGATGSIGDSVLSIVRENKQAINIEGVTCDTNLKKLCRIAKFYNVKKIGFNEKSISSNKKINLNDYKVFDDISNFHQMISNKTDIVIFAISGLLPLQLLLKILRSGKKIGIANKECIITLGSKFNYFSKKYSTKIIPLDSEHNSIYHLLSDKLGKPKSITITASGGPFFKFNKRQLNNVKLSQAVRHPIWNMGKKISVDSATMMNKALEIIEAKYLFDLNHQEINAIIHPQAIVHALINYENGTSTAILNKPDMRIPISSLFFNFNKFSSKEFLLDLTKTPNLEFFNIDQKRFPALRICFQVMKMGGAAPHIFNYLNELLVDLFLQNRIKFIDIVKFIEINLDMYFRNNSNISDPTLVDLKNINNWIDNNLYTGN